MNAQNIVFFANGANFMFLLGTGILMLRSKDCTRMGNILGMLSIYFAIWTFKDIFVCFNSNEIVWFKELIVYVDGWSAIAYGVYLIELSSPHWVTAKKIMLMFIPFAAFTTLHILMPSKLLFIMYIVFLVIVGLTIATVSVINSIKYLRYIRNTFSDLENIDISWLKYIYVWFVIMQLLWVVDAINPTYLLDTIYYTVFSIGWYRVVHHSKNLKSITIEDEDEQNDSSVDDYTANGSRYPFAGHIESIIIDEELYKKPDLSLYDLTMAANTNRTYLSNYFRNVLNTTFYDYINRLRIEKAAVPLMKGNDNLTIDAIALMSGFNSISTFRRAFYKYMKIMPSQYRASLSENALNDDDAEKSTE